MEEIYFSFDLLYTFKNDILLFKNESEEYWIGYIVYGTEKLKFYSVEKEKYERYFSECEQFLRDYSDDIKCTTFMYGKILTHNALKEGEKKLISQFINSFKRFMMNNVINRSPGCDKMQEIKKNQNDVTLNFPKYGDVTAFIDGVLFIPEEFEYKRYFYMIQKWHKEFETYFKNNIHRFNWDVDFRDNEVSIKISYKYLRDEMGFDDEIKRYILNFR
jgi:hypothetical protein